LFFSFPPCYQVRDWVEKNTQHRTRFHSRTVHTHTHASIYM
jgi:tRNA nucleotidyltransferase (CCA-adding enzyme)